MIAGCGAWLVNKTGRSNTSKEGLESRALRKIAGAVCLSSKSSAALLAAGRQRCLRLSL